LVLLRVAKTITSALETDSSAVVRFDEPCGVDGAKMKILWHALAAPH
jgi:hypothetical protein